MEYTKAYTKLIDQQRLAGGVPVPTSGTSGALETYRFSCPQMLHFGDPGIEYRAAREDAVVFDVSDRVQIELRGSDAQNFLNSFCTNDIKRLVVGEGCEAFVTNVKGCVLAHVFVFVANESVWIETSPNAEHTLLSHFDRYHFREDVEPVARTDEYGELLVSGPRSIERLSACGIDAGGLEGFAHIQAERPDCGMVIRRVDWFAQSAFLLSIDRGRLGDLWRELTEASVRPAGAVAFHTTRIEAGFPWYGLDICDRNLAQEVARTQQAISFAKGCYLGQEPIARIDALGHVNRELYRFDLDTALAPHAGTTVRSADGRDVGEITSSAEVFGQGRSVALGYVRGRDVAHESTFVIGVNESEAGACGCSCASTVSALRGRLNG